MLESLYSQMKTAAVSISGSGDNTVITASTSKRFAVMRIYLEAAGAVDVVVKTGSTSLTGAIPVPTSPTPLEFSNDGYPVFLSENKNEAFILNLSGAVAVEGFVTYSEVHV